MDPADEADAEAGLNSDPAHTGVGMDNLDAILDERDQWKDRALRAVAEVENIKRRAETQNNDARAYAIQRFARDLLGVADNLERALQAAPKNAEGAEAGLVTGLELTQKSLLSAFASNNLVRVAPEAG
ncbi:MAG TPA: nucleotide exchange factor GrpE, partial [Brevundimonas sp.]|nr:nucleotide exchange factor GrpE [Brevundimonas sp.]